MSLLRASRSAHMRAQYPSERQSPPRSPANRSRLCGLPIEIDPAAMIAWDTVRDERVVVEGVAGGALVEALQGAELWVVGSCGRGGSRGLLLGSVSQQCAHHASRPVVIVPHGRET